MSQKSRYVLMQRSGHILLSQITGESKPIVVHDMDILLILLCASHTNIGDICKSFALHPWVTAVAPNIQAQSVVNRIEYLGLAGYINALDEVDTPEQVTLDKQSAISFDVNETFRTCMNLAVEITANGFVVWSSRLQKKLSLPLQWVLVLMAFGDGKKTTDVVDNQSKYFNSAEDIVCITEWLRSAGLLVGVTIVEKGNQGHIPHFRTQSNQADRCVSWQELVPDNRIPVYFVPHMENHFPLALGVLYSALSHFDHGALLNRFQLIPIQFLTPDELLNGPYKKFGPGFWLFSNYMWSVELNLKISAAVKMHHNANITIHGGPSTPDYQLACESFMATNPSVDISVHGEGEVAICEIFCTISTKFPQQGYDDYAFYTMGTWYKSHRFSERTT